ncbi:hypothetical protein [Sphingomonas lenta]|uniref:Uncharacterized protein n=1 Tax=Sphingomonas lenta TaxID=1141887 RepID=A0A2A2SBB5_9SPHN|nr:hypothetical protein [Sphingomonas lenta]PAX06546.1 hypothetical protein CKY28_15440 [Sphingomonas lenta]
MASFIPVHAYWRGDAPDDAALKAALSARVRALGLSVADGPGLLVELAAGVSLFLDRRVGRRAEFALSGPDLSLAFGAAEEARVVEAVPALAEALVRDAGAAVCFAGGVRREFMEERVAAFDAAMDRWDGRAPLPLRVLGEGAWLVRWAASLPADVEPARTADGVAGRDWPPPSF